MRSDAKNKRLPAWTSVLRLSETRSRSIAVTGPFKEMLIEWFKGVQDGNDYNNRAGDVIAAYLSALYTCSKEDAWAAMMVWCESHNTGE